ncbi:MAG: phosphatase PAP2 family protein [Candidatus Micrarchaeota archaeon]|nr:phosphatase PAP2 family protein [Candidatus Micrarchaeota archaeon]
MSQIAKLADMFALFLHDNLHFFATSLALLGIAYFLNERKRAYLAASSLLIAVLIGIGLKGILAQERPCIAEAGLIECPSDYALPSLHSLVSFTLAAAFFPTRLFPFYFLFGWIVSFSRMHLGVHTFEQTIAGLALSFLPCAIAELMHKKLGLALPSEAHSQKTSTGTHEHERQLVHLASCIAAAAMLFFAGPGFALHAVAAIATAGMLLSWMQLFWKSKLLSAVLLRLDRQTNIPGYGAITLFLGILAILSLLPSKEQMAAALVVLGAGDAASTFIGKKGKIRLPYNNAKTAEGSAAFFVASLPSALFVGWKALPVILAASLAESLSSTDDNLLISLVCVVGFALLF